MHARIRDTHTFAIVNFTHIYAYAHLATAVHGYGRQVKIVEIFVAKKVEQRNVILS